MNDQNYYPVRGRARDFRKRAKRALKGFWWIAAVATLLAAILGGVTLSGGGSVSIGSGSNVSFDMSDINTPENPDSEGSIGIIGGAEEGTPGEPILTPEEAEEFEKALADFDFSAMAEFFGEDYPLVAFILSSFVAVIVIGSLVVFALHLFVSSPIKVGYQKFCLNVLDGKRDNINLGTLFERFGYGYLKTVGLNFVHTLIMNLTLIPMYLGLFIGLAQFVGTLPALLASEAPGAIIFSFLTFMGLAYLGALISIVISIPVSYMYSMAHLIMADYPGVGPIEALRLSRQMMRGNKWRLFCLDFSFIGWELLALCCTCTLGLYFVTPYQHVARAAFYEEISNRNVSDDVEFPSVNPEDYYIE